ncbi:MAG: HAMP domain-containing protein [Planctomycetes bacterium]|nr:HAMP domain-containing protein [Planctomycetota bacterium]
MASKPASATGLAAQPRSSSFRLRIAVGSAVLSGLALAAFALTSWFTVYQLSEKGLEQQIRELGQRELGRGHRMEHWRRLSRLLNFVFEPQEGEAATAVLKVWNLRGEVVHVSADWPATYPDADVPLESDRADLLDGPDPGPGPGGFGLGPGRRNGAVHEPPGQFFRNQDLNHDGRVSLAEFDGPSEEFHRLDIDRDGFIRPEEVPPDLNNPLDEAIDPWFVTQPVYFNISAEGNDWRVGVLANPEVKIALGVSKNTLQSELKRMAQAFGIVVPIVLLLIAGAGWWFAGSALRPVAALTAAAKRVSATGLDQRIAHENEATEFRRLIDVFNQMLDRLQRSFEQANRFSADAAHELQTPLSILQGQIEHSIQSAPIGSETQQIGASLLVEVQRLKAIVRKLLLLALADSGNLPLAMKELRLDSLLADMVDDCRAMAPQLQIESELQPNISVNADAAMLHQALQNLLDNAVKYNRADGRLQIRLWQHERRIYVAVGNSGEVIQAQNAKRIFERFYRQDAAHSRSVDGTGLGLSLAREIARSHRGDLRLATSKDDWTEFELWLPAPLPG